ncbi:MULTISPECIES: TonB-dependent receptor [Sphingobium]|jgi:iron complex outermembrane receptor protein|uniref:TonB-dependent receptor n=1 Tax=Sphingobium limneticum TaxID=1007511 RepID=A0A5J5HV16_9SPHN|nr:MULTISPECIES: TonB-dependent receptor [Sphingobium]KAA9011786.1 TonB-dependent receptor [Sphingobium limneticum]KAA9012572.1 TonB-dependent receptor [Sphingobium limneticum]KAA9024417.1 TonB-dependent receptor [Sphingobium limneticum]BBD02774.1 iron complex outermembrane recepter protein [Sphingobium sp. YG1]
MIKKILWSATILSSAIVPQMVFAQNTQVSDGGLAEIVVTAQRREESLQKAAIAVTAVTGDDLTRSGITETSNLGKLVPALVVQPTGGTTSFFLRGVGTNSQNSFSENAIAFNFNGVYVGRPTAPAGVFYDLERVEVVKGPQGTLYGRNATGGAINVLPKKPVLGKFGVEGLAEYGNYDSKKGFLAVNVPFGEVAALRVAGQVVDRDGYISDGYDDDKGEAVRASFLLKPSDIWSINIVGDYYHQGGKGGGAVLLPSKAFAVPSVNDRVSISDPRALAAINGYASTLFAPPFCAGGFITSGCIENARSDGYLDNHFYGLSAQVDGDMGFATLSVIPAWRKSEADFRTYLPGFRGEIQDNAEQMSLEMRLTSAADQRLRYVLGGFFFNEQQDTLNYFRQGRLSTTRFTPRLKTQSLAAFGQLTFDITDALRLIAGGRYTQEDKSQLTASAGGGLPGPVDPPLGIPVTGDLRFNKFTWKAGIELDAGPASLVYANVATGFKSGGFYVAAPPTNSFRPESLTAYTIGAKNRFFGNKLQLNIEAFYWDYKDQQVTFVGGVQTGNGLFAQGSLTTNAGKSRIFGTEIEARFAPTRDDLFNVNVQYLNGKYKGLQTANFSPTGAPVTTGCSITGSRLANPGINSARFYDIDCSGKPTVNSPRWALNMGYQHSFHIGGDMVLVAGVRSNIETSRYMNSNFRSEEKQGSFMMSDAFLTLEGPQDKWSVTAFINNIEDKEVLARAGTRPILDFPVGTLRPPRTYGVRLGFNL